MARKNGKPGRASQMRQVYKLTKQTDRFIGLILLGTFLAAALAAFGLLSLIPPGWFAVDLVTAIFIGLIAMIFVFGRGSEDGSCTVRSNGSAPS